MKKDFLKTKNLSRSALKEISGGVKIPVVNCLTLCGPGGGVISNRPGIGDACNPDRTICCICY
ncbi:hypothetical protein B0A69_06825 [Chryseobacterium shigense]|uniref:Uncharacterized protein n=1 Tax=Chryseobacterium shigense TaxID=297244 RepID=A0A1N7I591_9FLAO|nr:hypothetical protein [Chryseobacterium shigense]PQA95153.1 hypothetical protein B0A69_06825 [Chryseobacterium shigense]SIS32231.1 hypothetical protein SAMN05421639_102135 [Chryseobacterium shigense]